MRISDIIAQEILQLLNESEVNTAEIQRNVLASKLGCAPSQINYVLSSRFTPEHGFIIESRRGGGGYIRIRRVILNQSVALMHVINAVGDRIDGMCARIIIENCLETGLFDKESARIMSAAISNSAIQCIPPVYQDTMRASVLKQMLLTQI